MLALSLTAPTHGQRAQPARNLAALSGLSGETIYIEDRNGRETAARCLAANDREILISVGGVERRVGVADIRRITVGGDSLTNGALIGGAIGIPWGIMGCQGHRTSNCPLAVYAGLGVAIFGGVGAWIDSRRDSRKVVYLAP